jgi:hypothetical protein
MTDNAKIKGSSSNTQNSDIINNFLNNIPTKYNPIRDYPENSNSKINGKSIAARKVVGSVLTGTGIAGLVGAGIAGTLVATKIGVAGVVAALGGVVGAAAAPFVAFVAIPVTLVALTEIGAFCLSTKAS